MNQKIVGIYLFNHFSSIVMGKTGLEHDFLTHTKEATNQNLGWNPIQVQGDVIHFKHENFVFGN